MFDTHARLRTDSAHFPAAVEENAHALLRRSGYRELENIHCTYLHGILVLQGQVSHNYLLQLAQALVSSVEGVHDIENRVLVESDRFALAAH